MMLIFCEMGVIGLPICALILSALFGKEQSKVRLLALGQIAALAAALAGLSTFIADTHTQILHVATFVEFKFDFLAASMLLLIAFISSVVVNYSDRYLLGEVMRVGFVRNVAALAVFASMLVASNDLALCVVAWCGISVLLVRLTGKSKASAARIVFSHHLFSDVLLIAATLLIANACGTTELTQVIANAHVLTEHPFNLFGYDLPFTQVSAVNLLLVVSMCAKTALFPFHRWLLATLEAPTPLSGLLHAGIVNVAAILAWRIFPVLWLSPYVLVFWGVVAGVSAVAGTLISSTQSDVKRKLVYSTVGQMGFMCLQCAVGALPAAVFHLITHGLFKCHLFLRSGSMVSEGLVKRRWNHSQTEQPSRWGALFGWACVALIVVPVCFWLLRDVSPGSKTALSVLIMTGAVASALPALKRIGWGAFVIAGVAFVTAVVVARFFAEQFDVLASEPLIYAPWLFSACVAMFAVTAALLQLTRNTPAGQALYVHALNGFYIEEFFYAMRNRLRLVIVSLFKRAPVVPVAQDQSERPLVMTTKKKDEER